jgi:hypothetical protein
MYYMAVVGCKYDAVVSYVDVGFSFRTPNFYPVLKSCEKKQFSTPETSVEIRGHRSDVLTLRFFCACSSG